MREFTKSLEGRLRALEIKRRRYEWAYERDYKFPGWSKEKSLQMVRLIDREIQEIKGRLSRG